MNDQLDNPQSVEVLEPPVEPKRRKVAAPSTRLVPAHPPEKPKVVKRSAVDDNEADSEDDSFVGRHGGKLTVLALLAVGCATAWLIAQPKSTSIRKAPERMVTIQPLPPPPAPPPPPPPKIQPPPPQEQKMIEQAPVEEKEPDPEPKPSDEPPALGTGIKGDGPADGFGLRSNGNGGRIGGSGLGSGRGGGPFDGFARKAQSRVQSAIASHRKTRSARIPGSEIRVWVDSTGRVIRVKVSPSTGDAATDAALQGEVLAGVQLEPPPAGMPMPIVMRVSARRPN